MKTAIIIRSKATDILRMTTFFIVMALVLTSQRVVDSLKRISSKFTPSQEGWAGRLCCLVDLLSLSEELASSCCDWSAFESLDNFWMNQPSKDSTLRGGVYPCCMYPSVQQWAVFQYLLKQKNEAWTKIYVERESSSDRMRHCSWVVNVGLLWFMAEWRSSALPTVWLISLFISIRFITYQLYKCKGSSENITQVCPLRQPELGVERRCCLYVVLN